MAMITVIGVVLLWMVISHVARDVEKNRRANSIRLEERPSRCAKCGYEKWSLRPDYGCFEVGKAIRNVCDACRARNLETLRKRADDIRRNPFEPRMVPLDNGGHAIVENRDYDAVLQHRWYKDKDGYAVTKDFMGRKMSMHRFVKGLKYVRGYHVHHKNHNPLDNRRKNLIRTTPERHQRLHNP